MNVRSIAIVLFLFPSLALAESAPAGFVAAFRGDARIVRGKDVVEARIGQEIFVGDELITGKKARLKVLLTDDAIISLGANTNLRLTKHLFEPSKHKRISRFDLVKGLVRALVKHMVADSEADFEIRHSNAVAGVRGTEFAMYTTGNGVKLATLSGTVAFSKDGGRPVLVTAGQGSVVEQGGPSSPNALAAADLSALRSATDVVQSPSALAMNLSPDQKALMGTPTVKNNVVLDPLSPSDSTGETPGQLYGGFTGRQGKDNDINIGNGRPDGGLGLSGGASFTGQGPALDGENGFSELEGDWNTGIFGDTNTFYNIDVQLKIVLERR